MHRLKGDGFGCNVVSPKETLRALVCGGSGRERNVIWGVKGLSLAVPVGRGHPRWLTVRECTKSLEFPDWFVHHPAKTYAYCHFGNAVPVPIIQAVGERVLNALVVVGLL